ncbi:hypothetical protein N7495_000396 [Penicillium taxi]|uniref:uncharacterized protein n=1 Tax=Penicillium taxi TaxID=168475 RepID=UPI002544FD73|nr:uncharacterized protein N7495_000396 [Penicillium taxi]KAJ5907714.1 hypothetical protein N7495_000396 [Penicillium taxi]
MVIVLPLFAIVGNTDIPLHPVQASILRQIVASPRQKHPEAGLDLCYVTDKIIATSGPSATYPKRAYRNPLDTLVNFLDSKHGSNWCIWEFRAEGTGYPDSEVYGRIHHFPWPDHHPPPFALIPNIMGSMRNWLYGLEDKDEVPKEQELGERVAVVHCKAGKGRSGTIAVGYLISQEGWTMEDALQRFTDRRMRVGFGAGVSISSQLRYVGYIDIWANRLQKQYVERPVEILEIHVWGLREGVKVAVEGYEDEGKKIKCIHTFHHHERTVIESGGDSGDSTQNSANPSAISIPSTSQSDISATESASSSNGNMSAILFRPSKPLIIAGSDINIDFERRSKASYTGFAMVTSVAHVWFNTFFEGGHEHDSGVFETEWEAMDGIKGSTRKGIRALEKLQVVWRYPTPSVAKNQHLEAQDVNDTAPSTGKSISEPKPGEPITESHPADWRGANKENDPPVRIQDNVPRKADNHTAPVAALHKLENKLGLRKQDESKDVSLAGKDDTSATDEGKAKVKMDLHRNGSDIDGVKPYIENDGTGN